MIEPVLGNSNNARIVVVGVGGGGGNALATMIRNDLAGVDFLIANTDSQALGNSGAPVKIQIGIQLTKGLGAGANPDIGRKAAIEQEDLLREQLVGADMVFVTAGMGGGTGTGAAPVIARIAKDLGALTVGVVTKPFFFEGKKRSRQADEGIRELRAAVDTLIVIPNQRLIEISGRSTTTLEAFLRADEVLLQAVRGISQIITEAGLINVDFADVRTIMAEMGMAMMGAGIGHGDNRATEAAAAAISSPLLEDVSIGGARGVLINITASSDFGIHEMDEAIALIQNEAHEDANIIFGLVHDPRLDDEVRITVIATGVGDSAIDHRTHPRVEAAVSHAAHGSSHAGHSAPHASHAAPHRETARDSRAQHAPPRLPLIDDSVDDGPAPLHRHDHRTAQDASAGHDELAFPADPGDAQRDDSINIPAYLRRWRNRRRVPGGSSRGSD
jgi:cell division protein FtsZ